MLRRLLAGGAHIHVDFHAARHFDDLRCFPGHFGSPCKQDEFTPSFLNYRVMKTSPVNSFGPKLHALCCVATWPPGGPSKLEGNQGLHFPFPPATPVGSRP